MKTVDAHVRAVGLIVSRWLAGSMVAASALDGGYSGAAVYRVRVREVGSEHDIVVKLDRPRGPNPITPADTAVRMYSARTWSVPAVHALLREHGLPVYDLLGWGPPTEDVPFFWVAMSALEGVSVRDQLQHAREGAELTGLFRTAGEALAAVHAMTRAHDGAVDLDVPYAEPWDQAFFAYLDSFIARVRRRGNPTLDRLLRDHWHAIDAFVQERRRRWVPACQYVLSHFDGLQAIAARARGVWRLSGHLDLEDFSFREPRWALAAFELGVEGVRHRRRVPAAFWQAYRSIRSVDPSYEDTKDVFKLFHLLDWAQMGYEPASRAVMDLVTGAW
ncbi:MAG: hypothetical protein HY332_04000 [Chloroflexi bacterium]|nr:hypothetical protein [Chloroflexota bacterium]